VDEPAVFPGSRKKAAWVLVIAIGLCSLSVFMATEKPLVGWLGALFFGLGIPVSIMMMRPGAMFLKLDAEGFEMSTFGKPHRTRWVDVRGFELGRIQGNKMIAIAYHEDYARQAAARAVASAVSGMEGAIPDSYAAPLEEILAALRTWHARYGRGASTPTAQ